MRSRREIPDAQRMTRKLFPEFVGSQDTRHVLEALLAAGQSVRIQTRSDLVHRDFDLLARLPGRVRLGTSPPHLSENPRLGPALDNRTVAVEAVPYAPPPEALALWPPAAHDAEMNALQFFLLGLAGWIHRNQQHVIEYLQEEVKVLKQQLGKKPRFNDEQRRRLAAKAKKIALPRLQAIASIVSPRTLLEWHQRLIARKYDGAGKRSPGRPPTSEDVRNLILRMAAENRTWGYTRIQGALQNLGHAIGRGTIAKVLKAAGVEPAPDRQKRTTWKEFLRIHWEVLAATDFFSVEVWTGLGLVRYHVLFVIRLATREVHMAGLIPEPRGPWMKQMARNLTDGLDGFLSGYRYLIHDRASVFSEEFQMILQAAGIESVRLPACSPNLNAFVERFVRSIKESCLDRIVLIGEASLHRAIAQFVLHYHQERNHQGLDNQIIRPEFPPFPTDGHIQCRKRLGGLLRYYYREAA